MRISVIGCGYLGTAHAVGSAELGFDVIGVEVNAQKLALLRDGRNSIEPGEWRRQGWDLRSTGRR